MELFKLESSRGPAGLRLAPKLTLSHIFLTFGKTMNVRYAAQLLSHSVSAGKQKKYIVQYIEICHIIPYHTIFLALIEYHQLKKLPDAALETAAVIEKIDEMFDLMNSVSTHQKGRKSVIKHIFLHSQMQVYSLI